MCQMIQLEKINSHIYMHSDMSEWDTDIKALVQMKWKAGLEQLPRWNRPTLGQKSTLADLFVPASCMPAGCLLGTFVWLITSLLSNTKMGRTCPSELGVSRSQSSPYREVKVTAPVLRRRLASSSPSSQSVTAISVTGSVWIKLSVGRLSIHLTSGLLPWQHFV